MGRLYPAKIRYSAFHQTEPFTDTHEMPVLIRRGRGTDFRRHTALISGDKPGGG